MKLNKIISVFCALIILVLSFVNLSIVSFASDDDIVFVEASKEEVLELLYDRMILAGKAYYMVFDEFCNMVNDDWGWTWNTDDYTFTDEQTGTVYGVYLDSAGQRGLARSGGSGGGGRKRITSGADIDISGETFADIIARLNEQYGVKNAKKFISLCTDKRYTDLDDNTQFNLSFYADGTFCGQSNWTDVYIKPFYFNGEDEYYSSFLTAHYTQEVVSTDQGNSINMYVEYLSDIDDTYSFKVPLVDYGSDDTLIDFAMYRYMDISCQVEKYSYKGIHHNLYTNYSDYLSKVAAESSYGWMMACADVDKSSDLLNFEYVYPLSDLANNDFSNENYFRSRASDCDPDYRNYVEGMDAGFYVSDQPITLGLNWTGIDPEKIDPELTVNMGGDTLYDYSVTNVNGDTTTINEYVTNNYTIYVDGGNSSGGGESGNTSGDISVSGDINVGGEVDININVNENSSMPVEVDVDNYIEVLPEQAKPVTNILALFFDFLPAELLALILAGVAVAIILRIWGR